MKFQNIHNNSTVLTLILFFIVGGLLLTGCPGSINAGPYAGYLPSDILYFAYTNMGDEDVIADLAETVDDWYGAMSVIDPDLGSLTYEVFSPGSDQIIDPMINLQAAVCSVLLNPDQTAGLEMAIQNLGCANLPAEYEIRHTFIPGPDNGNLEIATGDNSGEDGSFWFNPKMNAWLFRIANIYPESLDMETGRGSLRDLLEDAKVVMTEGLFEADSFEDRVYVLDLLNQLYQYSADVALLEQAAEIAASFPVDNPDEWFDPQMAAVMPDLAIALHHYGWLAEDEAARESARFITEQSMPLFEGLPEHYRNWMAFANEIVNSKCIHIGIVGSLDDEISWDLLEVALQNWDPRRIAQILDPERDEELIELKGYVSMSEPRAYTCIDNMCYMPSGEPDGVLETIQMAVEDLAIEAAEAAMEEIKGESAVEEVEDIEAMDDN